jgi:hypothetical protein
MPQATPSFQKMQAMRGKYTPYRDTGKGEIPGFQVRSGNDRVSSFEGWSCSKTPVSFNLVQMDMQAWAGHVRLSKTSRIQGHPA